MLTEAVPRVRRDRHGRAALLQIGKSLHDRKVSAGDGVRTEVAPQEIGDQIMSRPDPFVRTAGVGSGEEFAEGNHAIPDAHGQGLAVPACGPQRGNPPVWKRQQNRERLTWGEAWQDTGLVFTREDGSAWHPDAVKDAFERLAFAAHLPPVRLHDIRHAHISQ